MEKIKLSLQKLRDKFIADGADPIETDLFLAQAKVRIDVWTHFENLALKVWETGRRKYGAQTLMHVVRWDAEIERGVGEFDVNNNWIAYYARMFMYQYPEAAEVGFFEVRKFKEKGIYGADTRFDREIQDTRPDIIPQDIQLGDESSAEQNRQAGKQASIFGS